MGIFNHDFIESIIGSPTTDSVPMPTEDPIPIEEANPNQHVVSHITAMQDMLSRGTYTDTEYIIGLYNGLEYAKHLITNEPTKFVGEE